MNQDKKNRYFMNMMVELVILKKCVIEQYNENNIILININDDFIQSCNEHNIFHTQIDMKSILNLKKKLVEVNDKRKNEILDYL
jgi:hypothetical protein